MGGSPAQGSELSKAVELQALLQVNRRELNRVVALRSQIEAKLSLEERAEAILAELAKRGSNRLATLTVAGLQAVYGSAYSFRRDGKDLLVKDDAVEVELFSKGGGLTDILALLFRVLALQQGQAGRIRTLILDEPLKSVDAATARRTSAFLRMLSERLGIHVFMVTHRPELLEEATEVFTVKKVAGETKIELRPSSQEG